ncbi:MAG: hypothetical protein PHY82_00300 [Lentisphaeria bacterium]|nr:hypothetical protein [Lentisphaeria bacterium]
MKQKKLLFAFMAALLFHCAVLQGRELDLGSDVATPFEKDGQKVEVVGENGKKNLYFQWDTAKKTWGEFYWVKRIAPPWKDFKVLKIRVELRTGSASLPKNMMIRFTDLYGEVFQLSALIKLEKTGQASAEFMFPHDFKLQHSWKSGSNGRKDGGIDFPVSLTGIAVSFPLNSGIGDIYITSIDIEEEPFAGAASVTAQEGRSLPIKFDVFTGHPARIVQPDTGKYCYGVLLNTGDAPEDFSVEIFVRDHNGEQVEKTVAASGRIGSGARRYYRLPVPDKFGIYYVSAVVKISDATIKEPAKSFAFFQPTGHGIPYKKGQFRFGVQTHWGPQDMSVWEKEAEAFRTVGARFFRNGVSIQWLHGSPGVWSHSFFDGIIDFFLSRGIQLELVLNGSARWAAENPEDGKKSPRGNLPRLDVWKDFCEEVFRHYGDRLESFEIWNEPDLIHFALFSAEEYYKMAKIAYEARNRYAPDAELMSAGFCNFTSKNNFHENAMKLCKELFDVHCFHGHGTQKAFQGVIDQSLIPMRKKIGIETMPWYAHETALTGTGYGEKKQAEALFKKLIFAWSRGSIGYTWYDLRNDGIDPSNPEHNYGMLTHDFYPKAVYVVYNTLTALLNGNTTFEKDLSDGNGVLAFRFRRETEILIAAWHDRAGAASELMFKTDAESAEIIDLWGNRKPADRSGELVFMPVSGEPSALRLKNATRCEEGASILSAMDTRIYLGKENTSAVELTVSNAFGKTVTFDFEAKNPAGITVENMPQIVLPPEDRKSFPVGIKYDRSKIVPDSSICFSYKTGDGLKGFLSLPVNLIQSLQKEFGKEPFAVIDQREQVFELFDADPGNVFRLWKGPQDLSARLWVAADEKFFRLKVEAIDDQHRQPYSERSIWKGDSLQVFCAFSGQDQVWQFGCALLDDGEVERHVWHPETGFSPDISAFGCKVTRNEKRTVYELQVPWNAFGIEPQALKQGFRFNVMLNESDSNVRESWLQLAPGVGNVVDSQAYPVLEWEKRN